VIGVVVSRPIGTTLALTGVIGVTDGWVIGGTLLDRREATPEYLSDTAREIRADGQEPPARAYYPPD
jgi:hypothetical protein